MVAIRFPSRSRERSVVRATSALRDWSPSAVTASGILRFDSPRGQGDAVCRAFRRAVMAALRSRGSGRAAATFRPEDRPPVNECAAIGSRVRRLRRTRSRGLPRRRSPVNESLDQVDSWQLSAMWFRRWDSWDHEGAAFGAWVSLLLMTALALVLRVPPRTVVAVIAEVSGYCLPLARNVATGHGVTFDGLHSTNGFHRLWLFVLIPIFGVIHGSSELLFRFVASLVVVLRSVASLVFCRTLRRALAPSAPLGGWIQRSDSRASP